MSWGSIQTPFELQKVPADVLEVSELHQYRTSHVLVVLLGDSSLKTGKYPRKNPVCIRICIKIYSIGVRAGSMGGFLWLPERQQYA